MEEKPGCTDPVGGDLPDNLHKPKTDLKATEKETKQVSAMTKKGVTQQNTTRAEIEKPNVNTDLKLATLELEMPEIQLGTNPDTGLKRPLDFEMIWKQVYSSRKLHETKKKNIGMAPEDGQVETASTQIHDNARVQEEEEVGLSYKGPCSLALSFGGIELDKVMSQDGGSLLGAASMSVNIAAPSNGGTLDKPSNKQNTRGSNVERESQLAAKINNALSTPIVSGLVLANDSTGSPTDGEHNTSPRIALNTTRTSDPSSEHEVLISELQQEALGCFRSFAVLPKAAKFRFELKPLHYTPSHPGSLPQHIATSTQDPTLSLHHPSASYQFHHKSIDIGDSLAEFEGSPRRALIANTQVYPNTPQDPTNTTDPSHLLSSEHALTISHIENITMKSSVELAEHRAATETSKGTPNISHTKASQAYVDVPKDDTLYQPIAATTITHVNEPLHHAAADEVTDIPITKAVHPNNEMSHDSTVKVADKPIAAATTPSTAGPAKLTPLGDNNATRNKNLKPNLRTEKYMAPHLRVLTQPAPVASVHLVDDAGTEKSVKLSEALPSEPKLAPHLRILAQHAADKSINGKSVEPAVLNGPKLPPHLGALEQPTGTKSQTVDTTSIMEGMKPTSSDKTGLAKNEGMINDTEGFDATMASPVLSLDQVSPHVAQKVKEQYNTSASNSQIQPATPQTPKKRSPEETFVPFTPKSKATPKKLVTIHDLLPAHLKNLPKPVLQGPQVKRNAERAAQQAIINIKADADHIIQRNEESYLPTLDLEANKQLVLQLAANENAPVAGDTVVKDYSSVYTEVPDHLSMGSNHAKASKPKVWRWFNTKESSEPSETEFTPRKELHHELVGWDGGWNPPPIEWDLRGQFDNNSRSHLKWMEDWVLARTMELLNMPFKVDTSDKGWISGATPASGTRKQWQTYPAECLWARVPLEYGAIDWDMVPVLPPQDPFSNTDERRHQTSMSTAKQFRKEQREERKKQAEERFSRRLEQETLNREMAQCLAELAPKVNIFIRPAQLSDVLQITAIYNRYVQTTVHAPELDNTHEDEWRNRISDAGHSRLAFLVAVLKSTRRHGPSARQGRGGRHVDHRAGGNAGNRAHANVFQEIIVGFSYAEEHAGPRTMCEHAVELEVFVDPKHLRNGIGKALMDRIMMTLDRTYIGINATEFLGDGRMNYGPGGSRSVRKILISIAFHAADVDEFEWRKKWLDTLDFDHVGTMICMGQKFGKGVNIAYMVKETGQISGLSAWYPEVPPRIPYRERLLRAQAGLQ
ncbi:hypothetical protein MMC13_004171 [Lambiella insularis]|nr:hypothetical protein [Lambiella insularis]